jgi:peroxiredoxin
MSKAGRTKRQRTGSAAKPRTPPPPRAPAPSTARRSRLDPRRLVWIATAAAAAIVGIVVAVLVVTSGGSNKPPAPTAPIAAADRGAPPALVAAANKVGFQPTSEPGTGEIERRGLDAAPPLSPNLLPVGSKARDFDLKTPQGTSVRLSDFRGKAVLLEFFATWCPHCNAEAPHLAEIARQLGTSKYAFVSINGDSEDAASVYAYHRYWRLPFPALLDPGKQAGSFRSPGSAGPVSTAYRLNAFPTFYVIDPRGVIAWRNDGEQPDAVLRFELRRAAGA